MKNFITPKTGTSKNYADSIPKPSCHTPKTYNMNGAKLNVTGNQPSKLTVAARGSKTKGNISAY